jgi:adenylylsulfate kinase-like enzyme
VSRVDSESDQRRITLPDYQTLAAKLLAYFRRHESANPARWEPGRAAAQQWVGLLRLDQYRDDDLNRLDAQITALDTSAGCAIFELALLYHRWRTQLDPPTADSAPVRALLLTGTVGSGKTSVADAIGDLLTGAGTANAVIDVDWLRRSWPHPPDDRFNGRIALRNLSAVAQNYLQAGTTRLVLAGVIESRAERDAYQAAVAAPLTVCRLRVDLPTIRQRLTRRHETDDDGLRWHLDRSGELDQILEQAKVEDVVVEVTTMSVRQAAEAVIAAVGWRPRQPDDRATQPLSPATHSSTVDTSAWRGNTFVVSTRCTSGSASPHASASTTSP